MELVKCINMFQVFAESMTPLGVQNKYNTAESRLFTLKFVT
jgi:hypothetical protein